ncbi:MAG: hypothetical protein M3Y59_10065 [Myxococcota bacterium]|nr:hypothetical protein [Myxococcota bacterium]
MEMVGAVLAGCGVLAFSLARKDPRASLQLRPFYWAGILAVFLFALAVRLGLTSASHVLSGSSVARFVAVCCIGLAAYLALEAARLHRRADLLLSAPAVPVDEAIEAFRMGRSSGTGLFQGRIDAELPVISPGGAHCAFFEAQVRQGQDPRGALLGAEQGDAAVVDIRGRWRMLSASLATAEVLAPTEVRRAEARGQLAFASEQGQPGAIALSYERAAKVGDDCVVLGKIRPLEGGGFLVCGAGSDRPLIIIGQDAVSVGRRFVAQAWGTFAVAGGLCAASAWLLARFA